MRQIILIFLFTIIPVEIFSQDDNSKLLFETIGIWSGLLPCADCESISYKLNLKRNYTFLDRMTYNGKNVDNVISDGTWKYNNDSTIMLSSSSGSKSVFRLKGNEMVMLDDKGDYMIGPKPEMFHFQKLTKGEATTQDEKVLRGINFVATGNEPFWDVDINFAEFVKFTSLTDINDISAPAPGIVSIMDVAGVSYVTSNDSVTINVSVFQEECIDDMSGEKFPYRVTLDLQFKNGLPSKMFSGCGRYIMDKRLNKKWILEKLNGESVSSESFKNNRPSMEFSDSGNVGGNAGCNSYGGKFEGFGNKIKFGDSFIMTRMSCPEIDFEHKFMEAIKGKTLSYEFVEEKLLLKDVDVLVMEFNSLIR